MVATNLKTKVAIILLICSLFLLVPMTSLADDNIDYGVMPCLTYIADTKTTLSISGDTATVDCWVNGHVLDATKAKVIAELQVKNSATNWIPVAIWTDTQNAFKASVYETKTINPNNIYRVKATYTVWEGSQSETITAFTDEM